MKTDDDTPESWVQLGSSVLVRLLWPLGIWLRDKGFARHVHRVWDTRSTNGQYWEMYAWSIGPLVIPFSAPRRNQIEEWTTPRVLELWKAFERRPFARRPMYKPNDQGCRSHPGASAATKKDSE